MKRPRENSVPNDLESRLTSYFSAPVRGDPFHDAFDVDFESFWLSTVELRTAYEESPVVIAIKRTLYAVGKDETNENAKFHLVRLCRCYPIVGVSILMGAIRLTSTLLVCTLVDAVTVDVLFRGSRFARVSRSVAEKLVLEMLSRRGRASIEMHKVELARVVDVLRDVARNGAGSLETLRGVISTHESATNDFDRLLYYLPLEKFGALAELKSATVDGETPERGDEFETHKSSPPLPLDFPSDLEEFCLLARRSPDVVRDRWLELVDAMEKNTDPSLSKRYEELIRLSMLIDPNLRLSDSDVDRVGDLLGIDVESVDAYVSRVSRDA